MFIKNTLKLLFLFPFFTIAQNQGSDLKKIDDLLEKAERAYKDFEDTVCLEYAKKASELAIKATDHERQAESYYLMARSLATLNMQKESMQYVKKAEELGYAQTDIIHLAELKELKAYNYYSLGLDSQSSNEDKSIIQVLQNDHSTTSLMIKARAYGNISSYHYEIGYIDSALIYLKKEEALLKKIPENRIILGISEYFDTKGHLFLKTNKLDSALHYFNQGYIFKKKHKDSLLFMQYCAFADYYKATGEPLKALEYYLKTIENIKTHNVRHNDYLNIYKSISELYGILKQPDKEILYLKKYTQINDSLNLLKENKIDYVTAIILKEKDQRLNADKKTTVWIIVLISIISASIFYFVYKKYRKAKKSNLKNKKLVLQKEHETKDLKLKINASFEELITLAKTNNPNFYTRFQEVYPEFQKKLLQINPELQISELTLSAYIYLDFQTKEIADYTFKSFRTIQNRKNRLRKKLNLSSSENLNVWFKNLITAP